MILAFEKGYSAIPGAMAQPINKWSEFKKILRELREEEVKKKFETIIIDTADIAWDYAEKYICSNNSVDAIGDVPYGKGYSLLAKEYDECFRAIVQLGYGLVLISHSQDKVFKDETGKEYNKIVPTLDKRPQNIVSRMCDIIGYARPVDIEDAGVKTMLFMRGTSRFMAGSRFKYTPDYIEFTYDNLVQAIKDAIDKQAQEDGEELFTDKRENAYLENSQELDFDALQSEFNTMINKLQNNYTEAEFKSYWTPRIVHITDDNLGKGKKVGDLSRDQVEALDLVVSAMRDLLGAGMPVQNKE